MFRFALNIKRIPYQTEWVEYPDIGEVFQKHGIPAVHTNDDGSPLYTLPVIYDPATKQPIANSQDIVKYLDKTYPDTPPLFPPRTHVLMHASQVAFHHQLHVPLYPIVCCAACYCLLPRSQEFYRRTREEAQGKKLEDIRGKHEWREAEGAFDKLATWLSKNDVGQEDWVMGDGLCYADIVIAADLMWAKVTLGAGSEEWGRICSWNGGKWKRISDHFERYAYVDV